MSLQFAPGFHVPVGQAVNASAYDRWVGRWSRLFVPSLLAAARVSTSCMVLDISTGTGEAALLALPSVGSAGLVVGADISPEMLRAARARVNAPSFWPVAGDGQALPFKDASFGAVICQLGLQFFPDPALGLEEFRRVLRPGARAAICVISTPERAPMWGVLADTLAGFLPELRDVLHLSFALSDKARVETLFANAGFQEIRVERQTQADTMQSFDEYWAPVEAGTGSIPQCYLMLAEPERRLVRAEVKEKLARFETSGQLCMGVEMLIGSGRA